MKLPWYKTARRWIQMNITADICTDNQLENWRKQWSSLPYQGLLINCCSDTRFCQCGVDYVKPAENLGDQDIFGLYAAAAKEDGLAVAARFDMQYANQDYIEAYPQWFQRDKQGGYVLKESLGLAATCINGPYYSQVMPSVIEEIIRKYSVDAITDNSWKANYKTFVCYCENCKARFKKDTGLDLPEAVDWNDRVYRKWVQWGYTLRVELWDRLAERAKQAGGEDCIWAGMYHSDPMNRLNEFIDFHEISKRLRFLFLDHQCRDIKNGMDMEQNSMNGSMLHLLSHEDLLITQCTNHYVRYPQRGWFRLTAAPPVETLMWEQEGLMGGMAPMTHFTGTMTYDSRRFEISGDYLKWHESKEEYFKNRSELADVAVLWNQENGDYYGRDNTARAIWPWEGYRHALTKGRMPYLPINSHDIKKYGHRVKTLVMPELAVLSENEIDDVIAYLEKGGNLVLTGKSGLLGELGDPYRENAAGSRLWDYLGLSRSGEVGYSTELLGEDLEHCQSYFRITRSDHPVFAGFEKAQVVAFGGVLQQVKSTGALKMIADWIPGIPITPNEYSYPKQFCPDVGTVFAGTLKSGARVVYLAGDIDRLYAKNDLPDHAMLLQNAVRWTLNDDLMIRISGTGYISTKAYRQGNSMIIHMNNITGSNVRFGYADEFIPVGPLVVDVAYPAGDKTTVTGHVDCGSLPYEKKGSGISFTVDKLKTHEMIVIKG
ncbi:MAG: alpha-amylase family protein [Christensenellales bacterium]